VDTVQQFLVPVMMALFGLGAIVGGLFGGDFRWKPLGSSQVGPRMPAWFARPFFVLLGIVFLSAAAVLWNEK
jgi:hypothetical protein